MTLYINSWIDRADPCVTIHHRDDGKPLLHLEKHEINDYIEQGLFCLQDLYDTSSECQQELIKTITLARCKRELRCELEILFADCKENAHCPNRGNRDNIIDWFQFRTDKLPEANKTQRVKIQK